MKKSDHNKVHLDDKTADEVLQKVFASCSQEPNTIPFDILKKMDEQNRRWHFIAQCACIIILALLLLVPVLFFRPEIANVTLDTSPVDGKMYYHFIVKGHIPVYEVTATLNDKPVPVEDTDGDDGNAYKILIPENGILKVTAVLYNRQKTVRVVDVEAKDESAPELVSYSFEKDCVIITVTDTGSGIDFENITGVLPDQTEVLPLSYDEKAGTVTFAYPDETLNIYIPDCSGNHLQIVLSPKGAS